MRRRVLVLLLLLLVAVPASVAPAKPARPAAPAALPWNAMVPVGWQVRPAAGGRALLVFTVGAGSLGYPCAGMAVAQREGPRLAARLGVVAATRGSLSEVSAGRAEEGPALLWRGRLVLVATPAQARDLGLPTADAVAARWAEVLRAAARSTALPATLPGEIRLPVGETRVLALPPAWSGAAVEVAGGEAVTVGVKGGAVTLVGRAEGAATLHFRRGDREDQVVVRVLGRAGALASTVTAPIAGVGPDDEFLLDAVARAVEQSSRPVSGASATVHLMSGRPTVGAGCRVTAWLEGPGLAPVSGVVTVSVKASEARYGQPAWLAASNDPERIERDGVLLDTPTGAGAGVFYFHHQNAPDGPPRILQVRLENRSAAPLEVLVTESGAGPSRDELYAGHLATWRYLRWMTRGNGIVLRLAPRDACVLDERILQPRDVSCGLGLVQVVRGVPPALVVEALAAGPTEHFAPGEGAAGPPRPSAAIIRGRGLFGPPIVEIEATYVIGDTYAFIPVGGPPFQQPVGEGTPNVGNYGVDYRIHLRLVNPTAEERKVYVVFAVGGGLARGSLVVDGRLVQTPVMKPGGLREFLLAEYTLGPGAERASEVRALPEPGSNYPIRIIAKPLPPNQ